MDFISLRGKASEFRTSYVLVAINGNGDEQK